MLPLPEHRLEFCGRKILARSRTWGLTSSEATQLLAAFSEQSVFRATFPGRPIHRRMHAEVFFMPPGWHPIRPLGNLC